MQLPEADQHATDLHNLPNSRGVKAGFRKNYGLGALAARTAGWTARFVRGPVLAGK